MFVAVLLGISTAVVVAPVAGQVFPPDDPIVIEKALIRVKPIKIDPDTPLAKLLPNTPKNAAKVAAPFNEDLRQVAEIGVGEPIARTLKFEESVQQMADIFGRVNYLNGKKRDGFLDALIARRTDLQGVRFRMGAACRTSEVQGKIQPFLSMTIGEATRGCKSGNISMSDFTDTLAELQTRPVLITSKGLKVRVSPDLDDSYYRALVSTLIQVLGPEPEKLRLRLARSLATIPHIDATHALARLALFAPEKDVRDAALTGLRLRRDQDYTEILLQGFEYPLPEVSRRAAEAAIKLERKDLLPNMVNVLERRDPRLPTTRTENGKEVTVVRELVRVNHHHNCILCHAPGNTKDVPEWALKAPVPLPSEPFPSEGGYQSSPRFTPTPPEIFVRIDMTYLRQDFSRMLPVANPNPWPAQQRFDFFVRTRVVDEKETQAWKAAAKDTRSPYHESALVALRGLTGRDTEPTPQAWRALLKLQ
jgi:hypothetical protein